MLLVGHDDVMDFNDLLNASLPTATVKVGGHVLELRAITSAELDEMITRYPPPKERKDDLAFSDELRFELVARTVTNISLTPEQVREMFDRWARGDVTRLQGRCFDLNWLGSEDKSVPLSETGSDGTSDTP